jgi:hypothetical protein
VNRKKHLGLPHLQYFQAKKERVNHQNLNLKKHLNPKLNPKLVIKGQMKRKMRIPRKIKRRTEVRVY